LFEMKRCKECGIPDIIGRDQVWSSDGTIPIPGDPTFRMGIIEVPVIRAIAAKLEAIVGPAIHTMFMEGKRKNARHYIDTLLKGPLGFLVRHSNSGGKKAYQTLLQTSTALGYGHVILEVYERKTRVGGTIPNPYYTPLFVGDVRGVFESIERLPSKGSWEDKGESAKILVERMDGEDKLAKRFVFEEKARLPGNMKYSPCKTCGLPKELMRFKWNIEKGTITDTKANERVFIAGLNDINAVFMELEEAIGDPVPSAIIEVNHDYGLELVRKGVVTGYGDLVRGAGLKGLGFTSFSGNRERVKLTFNNPFNKHYILGRSLGVFEGLEGTKGEATVKEQPGALEITITGRGG